MNNIVLRGVNNIENVIARKIQNSVKKDDDMPVIKKGQYSVANDKDMSIRKEDGKYVKSDIWVLDTTGTNLMAAFALDYIDATRTLSNDIREVYDVLGIEAARQMIITEMMDVMETDITSEPLQNLGKFVEGTTVHASFEELPILMAFPIGRLEIMLDVEQPHAGRACEEHQRQVDGEHGVPAKEPDKHRGCEREREIAALSSMVERLQAELQARDAQIRGMQAQEDETESRVQDLLDEINGERLRLIEQITGLREELGK
jgi:hypothetical protein